MDGSRLFAGLPLLVLVAVAAVEAAWLMRRGVRYDWKGYWEYRKYKRPFHAVCAVSSGGTRRFGIEWSGS